MQRLTPQKGPLSKERERGDLSAEKQQEIKGFCLVIITVLSTRTHTVVLPSPFRA